MTRDEAITLVRAGLSGLPCVRVGAAHRALYCLVHDPHASNDALQHAHDGLVADLPELKRAVDRILAERIILPRPTKKGA